MHTILVMNSKGGWGKTRLATNLAVNYVGTVHGKGKPACVGFLPCL